MAATLKDILRRFIKKNRNNWERLPDKISMYLLDVHHAIGILELLRILIDDHDNFPPGFLTDPKVLHPLVPGHSGGALYVLERGVILENSTKAHGVAYAD